MLGRQNGRYIRGGVASARVTGIIHPGTRTHICARIYTFYRSDSDKGERFTGPRSAPAATSRVLVILCRRCRPANRYLMNMTNAWLPANHRALEAAVSMCDDRCPPLHSVPVFLGIRPEILGIRRPLSMDRWRFERNRAILEVTKKNIALLKYFVVIVACSF